MSRMQDMLTNMPGINQHWPGIDRTLARKRPNLGPNLARVRPKVGEAERWYSWKDG